jgi:CHAT domain-containing protein/Tfp pilus assembly protein PilF
LPRFTLLGRRSARIALSVLACLLPGSAWAQPEISKSQHFVKSGLIVESLVKGEEGERAGIRRGDILLTWSRGSARGDLDSPFRLFYLANEQASRGPVTIAGIRGSAKKVWIVGADDWGIGARPNFQDGLLSLYEQGLQLAKEKRLDDAVARWREAASLVRLSNPPSAAWLLLQAAQAVGPRGDRYESLFQEALQQGTEAGLLVRGVIYLSWGYGFLARNDLAGTQDCFEKALRDWQSLGTQTLLVAMGFDYAAWAAEQHGNVSKAEEYHREALHIAQSVAPNSTRTLLSLTYVGSILRKGGDFSSAETYYLRALAVAERRHLRDINTARILTALAALDHRRGNLDTAEARYRQSLAIVTQRVDPRTPDGLELAAALSDLAECLIDRHDTRSAEYYEAQALAIEQRLSPGSLGLAFSYGHLGKIARLDRDWDKAESYYQEALAIGKSVAPVSDTTAGVLSGLGRVARDRGQNEQAEGYFKQALAVLESLRPSGLAHAETLADLAGALYRGGQPEEAGRLYRQAFAEFESFALGGVDDDRSRYRADHVGYYKEYVDLLIDQGQLESAFEQLEASRARTLLEMLARSQIDVRHGVDPALLTRERNLRQSIGRRRQDRTRIAEKGQSGQQLAAMDEEIAALHQAYEQLQTEIRAESPSYAELVKPRPLTIRELQKLLDPETLLLEYSLDEERSHVFAVTQEALTAFELPPRKEIDLAARQLYMLLTERNRQVPGETETQKTRRVSLAEAAYNRTSSELSGMILGPLAGQLQNKRLLVVPDGALYYVPFAALPEPATSQNVPLARNHEIVNLPSESVLVVLRQQASQRQPMPKAVAVLADPVFVSSDSRVRLNAGAKTGIAAKSTSIRRMDEEAEKNAGLSGLPDFSTRLLTRSGADLGLSRHGRLWLPRLPFSRREADAIMAVTPQGLGLKAVDFDASRTTATSPQLAQYRIVHFATHGLLNSQHPELSGLVLSLVDKQGRPQDGFLQLQDIYNMNLEADLVVLSACETGLGQEVKGEGLIGLTRGFMYAGATRVVSSLWNVDDFATTKLMKAFYTYMEHDGKRPAQALREAQLSLLNDGRWASPYYWAGFTIQGEWR